MATIVEEAERGIRDAARGEGDYEEGAYELVPVSRAAIGLAERAAMGLTTERAELGVERAVAESAPLMFDWQRHLQTVTGASGLQLVLPETTTQEEWVAYLEAILAAGETTQFAMVECIRFGMRRYGVSLEDAVEVASRYTNRSVKTLMKFIRVADAFTPDELTGRHLAFSHYERVAEARLPVPIQREVLNIIERDRLTVEATDRLLRTLRNEVQNRPVGTVPCPTTNIEISAEALYRVATEDLPREQLGGLIVRLEEFYRTFGTGEMRYEGPIPPVLPWRVDGLTVKRRVELWFEGQGAGGATDMDLYHAFQDISVNTLRGRRVELFQAERLVIAGERQVTPSQSPVTVWAAAMPQDADETEAGRYPVPEIETIPELIPELIPEIERLPIPEGAGMDELGVF